MKLFDSHCHLQDPRIFEKAPNVIKIALDNGVVNFAVNGTSENDWHLVKKMGDSYPSIIPNFGLHPWFVNERNPNWFETLKKCFENTPSAAVGEIGLDKGSKGREIDFNVQVEVFRKQLELAKELRKPASVHCVRAFENLLEIMKSVGPFPDGVILHSFLGSAEVVPHLVRLGAYFSFSGFLMYLKESKAIKMLKSIPIDRILLETDSPDAFPRSGDSDLLVVPMGGDNSSSKKSINHPANIHVILKYVASMLEIKEEELAEISFRNAMRLFSYEGSKIPCHK